MDIRVREAEESDCGRLLELIRELAEFERAPLEVTLSAGQLKADGFGAHPLWKAFVAEIDGQIAGFALYYIRYSTWKGSRMYLEDILVTESMRAKGIGKKLFERILIEANEKGFNGITWQVLDWNEPALGFYRKYGAALDGEWLNASLSRDQVDLLLSRL